MDTTDLLLTDDKLSQLTAALSNLDSSGDPLQTCINEAVAEVARLTAGYTIDAACLTSWQRALALHKAYGLCGPVPADVVKLYEEARTELIAIARGERPNLPKADTSTSTGKGSWGSAQNIFSQDA